MLEQSRQTRSRQKSSRSWRAQTFVESAVLAPIAPPPQVRFRRADLDCDIHSFDQSLESVVQLARLDHKHYSAVLRSEVEPRGY